MSSSFILDLPTENETQLLGQALGNWLQAGDIVLLNGDLGAGKSSLARACIQAMPHVDGKPYEEEVPSPTFTLVQTYERAVAPVWHFDLYRLGEPEELYDLGWEEALSGGICLIEWPERLGYLKPEARLEIQLEHKDEGRTVTLTGIGIPPERLSKLRAST